MPSVLPDFSGMSGLFANFASGGGARRERDKACSVCGTTGREFLQSGFLGCDRCYGELSEILFPVIQKVQAGTRHSGKAPHLYGAKPRSDPANEYERLKHELESAVEAENFEEAMIIRDKIRALSDKKSDGKR